MFLRVNSSTLSTHDFVPVYFSETRMNSVSIQQCSGICTGLQLIYFDRDPVRSECNHIWFCKTVSVYSWWFETKLSLSFINYDSKFLFRLKNITFSSFWENI